MNNEKFISLTQLGESYTVEYKSCTENVSESVYESICSFLNHSGGYILLGVNSSFQFVFSLTYNEMSETNVHNSEEMSITDPENVHNSVEMSITAPKNVRDNSKMSEADEKMSETELLNVRDKKDVKKNKRQQAIVGLITKTPSITIDDLADILGVNEKTIRRDISELKSNGILERLGGDFGGKWIVKH